MYYHILTVKVFFAYLVPSSAKTWLSKWLEMFQWKFLNIFDISSTSVLVESHNKEKGIISCWNMVSDVPENASKYNTANYNAQKSTWKLGLQQLVIT